MTERLRYSRPATPVRISISPATQRGRSGTSTNADQVRGGVEEHVLRLGRKIRKQTFSTPHAGLARIEANLEQCGRPVIAQVLGNGPMLRCQCGGELGQGLGPEFKDAGLVDLEDGGSGRPSQSVNARIRSRCHNDDLTDAVLGCVEKEVVEELRRAAMPLMGRRTC